MDPKKQDEPQKEPEPTNELVSAADVWAALGLPGKPPELEGESFDKRVYAKEIIAEARRNVTNMHAKFDGHAYPVELWKALGLSGTPPKLVDDPNALSVNYKLVRQLVTDKLDRSMSEYVNDLCSTYTSWNRAYHLAVAFEAERNAADTKRLGDKPDS